MLALRPTQWASEFVATKYVSTVAISAATGVITVTYGAATPQISGSTLTLTPNINKAALAATASGSIDWACASSTSTTATAQGLAVTAGHPAGTLRADAVQVRIVSFPS